LGPFRKPLNSKKTLLRTSLERANLSLEQEKQEKFLVYLEELKRWNKKINLTAITEDSEIIEKHFINSLLFSFFIMPRRGLKVMDLGSGAGFPGLPVKILLPEVSMTLLEASQKKTAFLKHICRALELKEVECLAKRSEDLVKEKSRFDFYDMIITRAAGIERHEKAFSFLLKENGLFVVQKGLNQKDEKDLQRLCLLETRPYKNRDIVMQVYKKCFT
jgi:16S rRNA (guanine527-N7)-methyltransferase